MGGSVMALAGVLLQLNLLVSAASAPRPEARSRVESVGRTDSGALLEQADRMKALLATEVDEGLKSGARFAEAKALLQASLAGGSVDGTRQREAITRVLADESLAPADRFQISALDKEVAFRSRTYPGRSEAVAARVANARSLIQEFPSVEEGYGYLLSLATGSESATAKPLVGQLLESPASEELKAKARRVQGRLALEGEEFSLAGLDGDARAQVSGRPVVVYSWSVDQPMVLSLIQRLARIEGVAFVGINVDADPEPAAKAVALMGIPGLQLYDRGGLDGPLAKELHLTMTSSLLLVGSDGKVVDVAGHVDTETKVRRLVVTKGGRS